MDENSEEEASKKVVALKVPSLFIQSNNSITSSSKDGKPRGPMPASARRKLEENARKSETSNGDGSAEFHTDGGSGLNKPSSRGPMPASVRLKLEASMNQTAQEQKDVNLDDTAIVNSKDTTHIPVKRPMPASAKRKHENKANESPKPAERDSDEDESLTHTNGSKTDDNHKIKRAMPASVRLKLEGREHDNDSQANEPCSDAASAPAKIVGDFDNATTKPNRPMPASAKRKLQNDNDSDVSASGPAGGVRELSNQQHKAMPASAKRKLEATSEGKSSSSDVDMVSPGEDKNHSKEESSGNNFSAGDGHGSSHYGSERESLDGKNSGPSESNEPKKEASKIRISLDGIRFPTFSKPMPASAKNKANEKVKDKSDDTEEIKKRTRGSLQEHRTRENENEPEDPSGSDNLGELDQGRSRRAITAMIAATALEKIPCEYCDKGFFSVSTKNKHIRETHLKQDKPETNEQQQNKGKRVCPHCNRSFSNTKPKRIFLCHVSKCGKPFNIKCQQCEKMFQYEKQLHFHMAQAHGITAAEDDFESTMEDSSSNIDLPVQSPLSVTSNNDSKSSKQSHVEKPRPMPKSVKAKVDQVIASATPGRESQRTSNSFKRKIAEVLSNISSRNTKQDLDEENESGENDGPPRKKTIVYTGSRSKDGTESIRGRPMPASVRKKVEDRKPKETPATGSNESQEGDGLSDTECQVCHRVFSKWQSRRDHEKNIHSLENPRGRKETAPKMGASNEDIPSPKDQVDDTECEICHRVFSKWQKRRDHEKNIHSVANPRGRTTETSVLRDPSPEPPPPALDNTLSDLECEVCHKLFTKWYSRRDHERSMHSLSEPRGRSDTTAKEDVPPSTPLSDLVCEICHKKFKKWQYRKDHERKIHSIANPRIPKGREPTSKTAKAAADIPSPPPSPKTQPLNNLECEVCHKVFSKLYNRRKHEQTVHSIVNPRGQAENADARPEVKEASPPPPVSPIPENDFECQVCHTVFSEVANRKRHERTVHSIAEPRGRTTKGDALQTSTAASSPPTPAVSVSSSTKAKSFKSPIDLVKITRGPGKCPVCSTFVTKLRRHVASIHLKTGPPSPEEAPAIEEPKKFTPSTPAPPVRRSASKAYKIYKAAANKAKSKFTRSTAALRPVEKEKETEEEEVRKTRSNEEIKKTKPKEEVKTTKSKEKDEVVSKDPEPEEQEAEETDEITSTITTSFRSTCCDQKFEIKGTISDHMVMRYPKKKQLITCKICAHMFTHEEDFIIHIQYKHKKLLVGITKVIVPPPPEPAVAAKQDEPPAVEADARKQTRSSARHDLAHDPQENVKRTMVTNPPARDITPPPKTKDTNSKCTVVISPSERKLVEDAISNRPSNPLSKRTSRSTRAKSPSPEPMDTFDDDDDGPPDDHHPADDDDDVMEVDPVADIAITATFSQRPPSPRKNKLGLEEMPCGTCNEVFYSYEALRKHELYFHNVKTSSKMCPICGVYPTRLSRHLLAHENKTVRCSCAPCRLNFDEFSQLLKHNLEKHPGPDGGALCALNRPREVVEASMKKAQEGEPKEKPIYTCKICWRVFHSGSQCRRHVRNVHSEMVGEDVEEHIEKSGGDTEAEDKDTSVSTNENPKDSTAKLSTKNDSSSGQSTTEIRKSGRPMPASIRAKMEAKSDADQKSESDKSDKPKPSRPMPASVRAKLEEKSKDEKIESGPSSTVSSENKSNSKPTRPMPVSARAKLMKQNSTSSSEPATPKPTSTGVKPRPMPASVRAKLLNKPAEKNDDEDKDKTPPSSEPQTNDQDDRNDDDVLPEREEEAEKGDSQEVINLDDDDDDDVVAVEPEPPSVPTFSIFDDIAQHNPSALGMNNQPAGDDDDSQLSLQYQCKLCQKRFETRDGTKRHIRRSHSEYGPDHTENLYEEVYGTRDQLFSQQPKKTTSYPSDEEDEGEREIIIPRGTARRPKYNDDDDWSPTKSVAGVDKVRSRRTIPIPKPTDSTRTDLGELVFACKICGKKLDSSANVRRHISRAHRDVQLSSFEDGVVKLGIDSGYSPSFKSPSFSTSAKISSTSTSAAVKVKCKFCDKIMDKRQNMRWHIFRSHPEMSDQVEEGILEVEDDDEGETSTEKHSEFLNDEAEISMDDMVGMGEISVSASSRIQIDQPKSVTLSRKNSSDGEEQPVVFARKSKPGPASKKFQQPEERKPASPAAESGEDEDNNSPAQSPARDEPEEENETEPQPPVDTGPVGFTFQADLSSLFPTLGGAPGGLEALDDIDGGMSLD